MVIHRSGIPSGEHGAGLRGWLTLEGVCNKCGACCTISTPGGRLVCENLAIEHLGEPNGTFCRVYQDRVPDMSIRMLDDSGNVARVSKCCMGGEYETQAVLREGRESCSLQVRFLVD